MTRESLRPYLWMLCGSVSFAIMSVLARELGDHCDWQVVVMARAGLVLLFAALLAIHAGAPLVLWKPGILWLRSIAGSMSMMLTFYAFTHLPVADVLTLTNLFPLWVAILSWPLLGESPGLAIWPAILSGVVGVALIQQPHLAEGNLATLAALGASFFTAIAMLGLHRLQAIDTRAIVVHFSGVATVVAALCFTCLDRPRDLSTSLTGWAWLLLLGVGVTATIGQLFLTRAFAAGAPAKVSVIGLTQIVFAMLLEGVLWGRIPGAQTLLGTVLVLGPTAWLMLHGYRAHRLPQPEQTEVPTREAPINEPGAPCHAPQN